MQARVPDHTKACENIINEHLEDMAESLYKRDASTLEKFSNESAPVWKSTSVSGAPYAILH